MAARITVTEFVSLDGVMEAPGGEPDFKYPGWTFEFERGDDGNAFKLEETRQADGLLIGRRTYESFAGAWPDREGEFADKFNSMPKFVVSTTLSDPDWNNTTVLGSGDAAAQVRQLKEEFDGELQVPGSHRLVQELIENDLVDQVNLMVFPVILGTGKKAFEETPDRRNLKLSSSQVVGDGVLVAHLRARLTGGHPPRGLTLAGRRALGSPRGRRRRDRQPDHRAAARARRDAARRLRRVARRIDQRQVRDDRCHRQAPADPGDDAQAGAEGRAALAQPGRHREGEASAAPAAGAAIRSRRS